MYKYTACISDTLYLLSQNYNDLSNIGSYANSSSSPITVPSATSTTLYSFTFEKGTYIIVPTIYFGSSNSNGTYRRLRFASDESGTGGRVDMENVGPAPYVTISRPFILRFTSATTYYLQAAQDSGSDIDVSFVVNYLKLTDY